MDFFEITNLVDQNKKLNFAQKAVLRQIIGFNLNNKPFFGTNQYLADYFGCDVSTIKRSIAHLKSLSYITVTVDRKKHSSGDATWYNKRYIVPNYDAITGCETGLKQSKILTLEKSADLVATLDSIEPSKDATFEGNHDDEPIGGVFPDQDTIYTRMFSEAVCKPALRAEFSPDRTIKIINQEVFLQDVFKRKYPDFHEGEEITDELKEYLQGFFDSGIKNSLTLLEKYEAIPA